MALKDCVKPWVLELEPYQPGKPPEELERELGVENAIKLASNESPIGPSPRAMEAVRKTLAGVHRYPDGASFALRAALSQRRGVTGEQLGCGAGADEILELLAKAFLGPGDQAVYAWPSFAMYPIVTQGMGAQAVPVPLRGDLVHDLDAMRSAVVPETRVVFVCNPNNPTGTLAPRTEVLNLIENFPDQVLLVLDEAYFEFLDDPVNMISFIHSMPNLLLMRTFSKIYGLAGLRVGYGIGHPTFISALEKVRQPFNLNSMAQTAALAALDDDKHLHQTRDTNKTGLKYFGSEFDKLGIEFIPSHANFILARVGDGQQTFLDLQKHGVITRPMGSYQLPEWIRISIGTAEQNERCLNALTDLR